MQPLRKGMYLSNCFFFHVCFIGFYWNLCFLWSLKREIKWIRLSNKHEQLIIFSFFFFSIEWRRESQKQQWGTINKTAHTTYIAWSHILVSGSGSKQPMAGSHEDRSDFYGLYVECMSSARKKRKVQLAGRQKKRHNVLLTVLLAAYIPTYISGHSNGRNMPRLTFMMTEGKQDHTRWSVSAVATPK